MSYGQSSCNGEPVRVDETIGWLHVKERSLTAQDRAEQTIVTARKRISGIVILQVDVDTGGRPISVIPLSGQHELTAMFVDQTRRIRFYPFKKDGNPTCARFSVRYETGIGDQRGPGFAKFASLLGKCSELSDAGTDHAKTIEACHAAADAADKLASPQNNKGPVEAYTYYATALLLVNRLQDALIYADKAVFRSDAGFNSITDKALAYGIRGQVQGMLGNVTAAGIDLDRAENLERATFEVVRTPEERAFDSKVLRSVLTFHAALLTKAGQTNDAARLKDEAQKL